MTKSMTGYAKSSKNVKGYGNISIEVKSVNGKNFSASFRMPQELSFLEPEMRRMLFARIKRGNISVYISIDYSSEFIEEFVKERIKKLENLSKVSHFREFSNLLFSDIANSLPCAKRISDESGKDILKLADDCFVKHDKFRTREGKETKEDIDRYAEKLLKDIDFIKKISRDSVNRKKEKLYDLLKQKSEAYNQEILLYAEKVDISEEIFRFTSHLKKIHRENSGVSMTFILQEMLRETNTLSSKSEDIKIIERAISMKETIEKLKEQALNVE